MLRTIGHFYEVTIWMLALENVLEQSKITQEKDLILSLQTQVKETAELVVHFSDEKYFALKEIESLKDEIKSLQIENQDLKSKEFELNNLKKCTETKESVVVTRYCSNGNLKFRNLWRNLRFQLKR
ncbi:hypothetical protein Tco_0772936 [Tanacetum coccineum]|uniref:Uncharacterized protein n=1 Tax=Tanacetum coccineum TaxID=301880 RepID=A0ABQ4ZJG2_9ASTR